MKYWVKDDDEQQLMGMFYLLFSCRLKSFNPNYLSADNIDVLLLLILFKLAQQTAMKFKR